MKYAVLFIVAWGIFLGGHKVGWQKGFNRAWTDYERGFNDGIRSPHNVYKREHQTSEYQYSGFSEDLIKILCQQNDIDFEGSWLLSCPKCKEGGARHQKSLRGNILYGWHSRNWTLEEAKPDEVVDFNSYSQTYCEKCLYPLGTDWRIQGMIKLADIDTPELKIKDCYFVKGDPNDGFIDAIFIGN